jgi:hypothetical protein
MYGLILVLHNLMRWVVLICGAFALYRAFYGWYSKSLWTPVDRRSMLFYSISIDIQFLLGVLLYIFFSPLTTSFLGDIFRGQPVPGGETTFFGWEHVLGMLVAVVLVHISSARARKVTDPIRQHRTLAIFFTVSVISIIIAIPWWRPLLRI